MDRLHPSNTAASRDSRASLYDVADESGVVVRKRWHAGDIAESLSASAVLAACALRVDREGDDAASIGAVIGASPLRAAAWLRSRGAAVGHAASRSRLLGDEAAAYDAASRTRVARHSDKMSVVFAATRTAQIAAWLRPDRLAIALVSGSFRGTLGRDPCALVAVSATPQSIKLYDPAVDRVFELPHATVDQLRADANAAWEVLLAAVS